MKSKFPTDRYFRQCVGIDVSKSKFTACLCMLSWGCPAQFTESIEFANTKTGFNQLVKWARREAEKGKPILFLMEPTGTYYEDLAYHLHKLSFTVYVIPSGRVHAFFKEEGIKTKTDSVDAYGLALMGGCKPYLKEWNPPCPAYRELRQLTRLQVHFKDIRTMLTNHKEALSHQYAPCPIALKQIDAMIKSVDLRIGRNQAAIEELAGNNPEIKEKLDYIQSIKGLGFMAAITILAETDGFANISSRSQLASFAGLDVVAKDSGKSTPARHISKVGNTHLRRIVYLCSLSAAVYNPQMRALYSRISQRNPSKVARVAVMRKLLLLAYTLCKTKQLYDPGKIK
ncbi:IS110 family transposase [Duncaniella muris]|uniref:IS110 family transposase n=1 Tax=Duncaniella muris TaxID=2094150 RepID=UPI003F667F3C